MASRSRRRERHAARLENGYRLLPCLCRGTGKQLIFETDDDRWEFLELMRDCCREAGVTIVAWALMDDHVDLVLLDYEDEMSAAMQRLLLTYARRFNKRTGRTGCLFRERFERRSLDTDWQVMELFAPYMPIRRRRALL